MACAYTLVLLPVTQKRIAGVCSGTRSEIACDSSLLLPSARGATVARRQTHRHTHTRERDQSATSMFHPS